MKMAPPSKEKPRKRTWDREKDLHNYLHDKIKVHKTQNNKLNYFNNLLQKFVINNPKADSELMQFIDGSSSIIQSQLLHLEDQNREKNNNTDEQNLMECKEEQNGFLLDHMKLHGKSYVLEIVEDGVYLEYGDESSFEKQKDNNKLGVKKSRGGKSLNVDTNGVASTSRKGGRGKKLKGAAKLSAAKKRDNSNVASKAHKNAAGKTKRGRSRKNAVPVNVNGEGGGVSDACFDVNVKKEIQDDVDVDDDDDIIDIIPVESSDEVNPRKVAEFREKLMKELNRPYCEEEHKKLLRDISVRTPVQQHKDLRGGIKIYKGDQYGKSFLDHNLVLHADDRKIITCKTNTGEITLRRDDVTELRNYPQYLCATPQNTTGLLVTEAIKTQE